MSYRASYRGQQVGVHLGRHVSGQEPEPFAGLHRRAGEDYALHLLGLQGGNSGGYGQPTLARTGRADGEGHDGRTDGVNVELLAAGTGANRGPRGRGAAPRR